ncbi:thiolase family protein [Sphingomonas sp. SRS2]|uniref:thiolase family protein n=1 Tax=Sphingomonas sp. SRS2 TaxID=133190 RepID=UPI00061840CD|nr:thiolase family protein [Sphingomonas sp. SRS2]KKC26186.1 thiolase [Sphingomonas sp. SRS2]
MPDIYIGGVGVTPLGKHLNRSIRDLTAEAVAAALADAGIEREQIEAAWFCNTRLGALEGQHGIRGQVVLRSCGFERIPIFNTDNACASASSGLFQAYAAVRAGLFEAALVVGAEKMNYPDKRTEMFEAFKGSWDRELSEKHMGMLRAATADWELPPEARAGPAERSVFMEMYALQAHLHMKTFGTTARQIAEVASKNHWNSQFNPIAQYRFPVTVEEALADRMVAWPLTRAMCAPMSDGAAAIVVMSEAVARRSAAARAVRIRGIGVSSGSVRTAEAAEQHLTRTAAGRAYAMAGVAPGDVSLAEVHDASAIAEIIQSEHLGFCALGEGGPLVESGATRLGGRLPINSSGGLLSKGHPIGATGAIQLVELVEQLRGEAGERQVEGARIGLAENGGGFHGVEEAACVVTILERPNL